MKSTFAPAAALVFAAAAFARAQCIAAPTNIQIYDGYDCDSGIEMSWDDVPGATEYKIYRAPASNPEDAMLVGVEAGPNFYDYDAEYDVEYDFFVITVAPCGESAPSVTVQGTRNTGLAVPAWVSASDNQFCDLIVVEWDFSAFAPEYAIFRSQTDDFTTASLIDTASFPPYEDYSPAGNTAYYYWVIATSSCSQSDPSPSDVGYSNYGLYIFDHPTDLTVNAGESAIFHVTTSPFASYEWYRDGVWLHDNDRISGADTDTITISNVTDSDEGYYYCIARGGCGSEQSDSGYLTVDDAAGCPADLTGSSDPNDPAYGAPDGTADAADFFYFLDQFAAGNLERADLTGSSDPNAPGYGAPDGVLDASDFFYYLDLVVQGCP